ncbi:MAG: ABC transporter ATP-binding protein [Acidimicrobiia bacterium]|nr:ABC transporter ATP-binding protein [bacterium]MXX63876.1 ABC transporter ATP-binding protein [Acidimicrobiia bacterium]MCY3580465.1 ABC transporter ATP-binding protein [bacterium]MXZ07056.1 ABC transporter ATP-binding protein [Acidimicrobiia bacterium]MYD03390.1 ABC transporter ATP-binding protein [Acidimicrobiia bacterium]
MVSVTDRPVSPSGHRTDPAPLLSIKGLHTSVRSRGESFDVVRGLSLDVYPNEVLCLVGESGCGKSITALSVMGLLPDPPVRIREGEILFHGQDLVALGNKQMRDIRADSISMIFQDPLTSLDPVFTVGEVMVEVIRAHRDMNKSDARNLAGETLAKVGLPDPITRLDSYPHQLSGGMRQRVMIAMALVLDPEILIADEPTTALDVTVQAQILDQLLTEQRERNMAMLLITHDLAVVASIADRVAVMYSGEIVEQATVDELFENPRHPYTQGLLRALPKVSTVRQQLDPIPGLVPYLQFLPPGCSFAPRCPHALDRCWEEPPELVPDQEGRVFRCFNPQDFTER